jgi:hypothetical protein
VKRIWSWIKKLSWKWKLIIILALIIFTIVVAVPAAIYYTRARDAPDYSEIQAKATLTYRVNYDSGEGLVNESEYVLKVAETDVIKDSYRCYHIVTVMDPLPERKVNAIIVGSTKVTLAVQEIWRSQDDLRKVSEEVMQIDLPIVNTVVTEVTYSDYIGYPGWPYTIGDSWTYMVTYEPDTFLQEKWTDLFHAEVVADDEIVHMGDVQYECFKVVHTLVETSHSASPGAGVGATSIEYWPKDDMSFAPIQYESTIDFMGVETRLMIDADPQPAT